MGRRIRSSAQIVAAARRMRRAMTPVEQRLWEALRYGRVSGLRFRRQHPIGRFIADFGCPAHRLVVEVDGASHEGREEADQLRTEALALEGYRVLRFTNREVMTDLAGVLKVIRRAATADHPHLREPGPPPRCGGGWRA